MKNVMKILANTVVAALLLSSCEKDENKVYFEGGTAPVLTPSSTSNLVLTDGNKNNTAIRFDWTNPNYQFNTGLSSQDVTYVLQVDTAGANFKNPNLQEVAIARELGVTYTVKELSSIVSRNDAK